MSYTVCWQESVSVKVMPSWNDWLAQPSMSFLETFFAICLKKFRLFNRDVGSIGNPVSIARRCWVHPASQRITAGFGATSYRSGPPQIAAYPWRGSVVLVIAAGNESLPATNQQQSYVSASRGRVQAKLYVDSKEDVR